MRTEEQCPSGERYLFAKEYFSDNALAIWQAECLKRCKNNPTGVAHEKYIHWKQKEHEIAVFTLYAYADFDIPKKFDIIFHLDDPADFIRVDYQLTQSIHEAWLPQDGVGHGHKHLCVFSFNQAPPDIFNTLHKGDSKFSTHPKAQRALGFCNSTDFDAIKRNLAERIE